MRAVRGAWLLVLMPNPAKGPRRTEPSMADEAAGFCKSIPFFFGRVLVLGSSLL
jgi:hypothetical protein